ncbi:acyl-CoA carboxylase subunit epsilon [Actinokineospora inagensis]|uniref:acyl-CoA carboxylase subunit epsilon n=1 Tax=Actinokineospora inagensis TaxID=103730 RepID=UPI0003F894E7|nr:acyl-CoA carboxylase subunit epsilon [Actinokineospora inagensis]
MSSAEESRPLLRVVRGTPDDAELAALTTVIAAVASTPANTAQPAPPSTWSNRSAAVRRPLPHGPGAWRASVLPR